MLIKSNQIRWLSSHAFDYTYPFYQQQSLYLPLLGCNIALWPSGYTLISISPLEDTLALHPLENTFKVDCVYLQKPHLGNPLIFLWNAIPSHCWPRAKAFVNRMSNPSTRIKQEEYNIVYYILSHTAGTDMLRDETFPMTHGGLLHRDRQRQTLSLLNWKSSIAK